MFKMKLLALLLVVVGVYSCVDNDDHDNVLHSEAFENRTENHVFSMSENCAVDVADLNINDLQQRSQLYGGLHSNGLNYVLSNLSSSAELHTYLEKQSDDNFDILLDKVKELSVKFLYLSIDNAQVDEYMSSITTYNNSISNGQNIASWVNYSNFSGERLTALENIDLASTLESNRNAIDQAIRVFNEYAAENVNDEQALLSASLLSGTCEYWNCYDDNNDSGTSEIGGSIAAVVVSDVVSGGNGALWGSFAGPLGAFMVGLNAAIIGSSVTFVLGQVG